MRIPLPYLVVAGLTIAAVGLMMLSSWLVVVGATTLTGAALIAMARRAGRYG
jgi:hypothetical protein